MTRVRSLARKLAEERGIDTVLLDGPPGIGCPVHATLGGVGLVVAVTEPTPSGFSDMKRAIEVINHFKIPYGIIINKHDINAEHSERIEKFGKDNDVEIISKIPYDTAFAKALVNLTPIYEYEKRFVRLFDDMAENLNIEKIP